LVPPVGPPSGPRAPRTSRPGRQRRTRGRAPAAGSPAVPCIVLAANAATAECTRSPTLATRRPAAATTAGVSSSFQSPTPSRAAAWSGRDRRRRARARASEPRQEIIHAGEPASSSAATIWPCPRTPWSCTYRPKPHTHAMRARLLNSPPDGAIAQLGERLLCKQEVVGSIPTGSTRKNPGNSDITGCSIGVVQAEEASRRQADEATRARVSSSCSLAGALDCAFI